MIDKLIIQLHTVDIEILADKCRTLMASDDYNIKLFTDGFIKKLFKCSHFMLLKVYLLPFITWLDNTILIELATACEKVDSLELLRKFIHVIDDTKPITSYPLPTFSQLIIPLDDSEYTIMAVKTIQNCSGLVLKDVKDLKLLLTSQWKITGHTLLLVAIDYHYNFVYWMIPKQVQPLLEEKLNHGLYNPRGEDVLQVFLLPNENSSVDYSHQKVVNNPFIKNPFKVNCLSSIDLKEVCS